MNVREFPVECITRAPNAYTAVIGVNDDVGDGLPVVMREMELDAYRRNPVVMFQHGKGWMGAPDAMPVGRSTDVRFDEQGRLVADFEFLPGDAFASRVKNAWDRGFLRAASIGAKPVGGDMLTMRPGQHQKYRMTEWSIVAVPGDPDAVRSVQRAAVEAILTEPTNSEERNMTDADRQKLDETVSAAVTRALAHPEPKGGKVDPEAIVRSIAEPLTKAISDTVARAFQERDDAAAAAAKATADADKAKGDQDAAVAARVDLEVTCRGLVADDFVMRGKTDHEILVAAVGDAVPDADKRSDDYLRATVDQLTRDRTRAADFQQQHGLTRGNVHRPTGGPTGGLTRPLNAVDIQRLKKGA